MMEDSIVRDNLMKREGYAPYCGGDQSDKCHTMARSKWSNKLNQFTCSCGWVSQFPADFIERYKLQWNK